MKTMILIETEAEREIVRKVWDNMIRDMAEGPKYDGCNNISGDISYNMDEVLYMLSNPHAIVYDHRTENGDPLWDIYNFETREKETVEGDLAGLANAKAGNFPLF